MASSERLCRTCLRNDKLTPIFTKADQLERCSVALFLTTGLQVQFNDGLPQTICSECRDFIKAAIDFRSQCHRSEQTLLQLGFDRKQIDASYVPKINDYYQRCSRSLESTRSAVFSNCSAIETSAFSDAVGDFADLSRTEIKIENVKCEVKLESDENTEQSLRHGECDVNTLSFEEPYMNESFETWPAEPLKREADAALSEEYNRTSDVERRASQTSSLCWSDDSFEMETNVNPKQRERKRGPHLDREKTYGHLVDKPMGLPGTYKCKVCCKVLKNWSCFRNHAKLHIGLQFMCEACGKLYSTVTMLKRHKMSQHGAECTYRCCLCSFGTWDTERLKIHVRREHTKERPFVCDTCGAGFYERSNIIHHMAVHLVEKNVQCPRCPSKFKSQQHLMSHNWHVHCKQRVSCEICSKSYTCSGNLREHQRKIHGVFQKGLRLRAPQRRRKEPQPDGKPRRKRAEVTEWRYVRGSLDAIAPDE